MARKASKKNTPPLTFDLDDDLYGKLLALRKKSGARSMSQLIRHAVNAFDYNTLKNATKRHRQISVRLDAQMKSALAAVSRKRGMSAGSILRAALESLPPNPLIDDTTPKHTNQMATKKAAKKPAKKAARKPAVKKAAKKVAKKAAPKKAVKKAAKKVAKKAAPKKAVKKAAKKVAKKKK